MNKILQIILFPIQMLLRLFFKEYELKIASSYLFSFKRDFSFISIITMISFLGITIGIASLIIIISIFNGFRDFAQEQVINFDPHIKIILKDSEKNSTQSNTKSIEDKQKEIETYLKSRKKTLYYSPVINGKVIIKLKESLQVANLTGLDSNKIKEVSGVENRCVGGKFSISKHGNIPNIVIGIGLADKLEIVPFDTIFLMSPDMIEHSIKQMDLNYQTPARVSGFFMSHSKQYDESTVFSSIEFAQELFFKNNNIKKSFDIRLKDINEVDKEINLLKTKFPEENILSWYDLHSDMFNIMKLERLLVFVVLSLIILIAVFNLLSSLTMTVIEKQSDIAIFKVLGAENKSVKNIFTAEGVLIGITSVFWGTILGLLFCYGQEYFNWFSLDTTKYLIKGIPISVEYWNIILIDFFALILSIVSTIIPANYAFNQEITEAIRNE